MKYISDLHDGEHINDIYLIKTRQSAVTKNGKPYENLTVSDRTGSLNAKIWEPNSGGIEEFEELDYAYLTGDVSSYQGALQISVKRLKVAKEGEYDPSDYLPVSSRDSDEMYQDLTNVINTVKNRLEVCFHHEFLRFGQIQATAHQVKELFFVHLADTYRMMPIHIIFMGQHDGYTAVLYMIGQYHNFLVLTAHRALGTCEEIQSAAEGLFRTT